jgi:hypothetical protein
MMLMVLIGVLRRVAGPIESTWGMILADACRPFRMDVRVECRHQMSTVPRRDWGSKGESLVVVDFLACFYAGGGR